MNEKLKAKVNPKPDSRAYSIIIYVMGNVLDAAVTVLAKANNFQELNPLLKNNYWILTKFSLAAVILLLLFNRAALLRLVGFVLILIATTMLAWVGLAKLVESGNFPL